MPSELRWGLPTALRCRSRLSIRHAHGRGLDGHTALYEGMQIRKVTVSHSHSLQSPVRDDRGASLVGAVTFCLVITAILALALPAMSRVLNNAQAVNRQVACTQNAVAAAADAMPNPSSPMVSVPSGHGPASCTAPVTVP